MVVGVRIGVEIIKEQEVMGPTLRWSIKKD